MVDPTLETPPAEPDLDLEGPPDSGHTNATLAMQASRLKFRIPGDVITRALANAPSEDREALRWFAGYCRDKDLGRDEMGKLLKKPDGQFYSYDSIYQSLTGRRSEQGVSLAPMIAAIQVLRKSAQLAQDRQELVTSGFIETQLYDRLLRLFKRALLRKKIGFVFGDSHVGKTECAIQLQRKHNHGQTRYWRMPTRGTLGSLYDVAARDLDISSRNVNGRVRNRIMDGIDDTMLIIVDEVHECLKTERGIDSVDFIREIHDVKRCGVMLLSTNVFRDEILSGARKKMLRQLWRRRCGVVQVDPVPCESDLNKFSEKFGLSPAPKPPITVEIKDKNMELTYSPAKLQENVIAVEGLGVWISILQEASDVAREAGKPIGWGAVIRAYSEFGTDL